MPKSYNLYTLQNLKAGQHVGWIYNSEEEHRAVITPYLRRGLEMGEKVLYIIDAHSPDTILEYLQDDGLEIEHFLASGQFNIIHADDAYMKNGRFDPHRVIDTLWDERGRALASGYPSLRMTSEMSWVARNPAEVENLIIYEAELNRFFPSRAGYGNCLAICQYELGSFEADTLLQILATHPVIISGTEVCDNYHYQTPEDFFHPQRSSRVLQHSLKDLREQRKAEELLQKGEEQYKSIYDNAPVGIQLYSLSGKLLSANRTCLEMFGVTDIALLEEFNLFKNFNMTNKVVDKIGTAGAVRFESTIDFSRVTFLNLVDTRKSGVIYLDVTVTEVSAGQKGFRGGYLVCLQDISKRKKDEQYLKKSEDRFRSVIEVASDAIISCDSTGNIISWNNAAETMFGYTVDEMNGESVTKVITPGARPEFEAAMKRLPVQKKGHTGENNTMESWGLRKTRIEFPVEITLSKWKAGSGEFFTVIIRDISDRRKIESELRMKESAIASSINPIALVDIQSNITYVNPSFLRTWNYNTEQEVIGRPATYFWDSPAKATRTIATLPGKGWIGELTARKQDGTEFPVQLSSTIVNDSRNRPSHMVASFVDISGVGSSGNGNGNGNGARSGFETMVDVAGDFFTIWDSELNLKDYNQAALKLFPTGMKKESIVDTNLFTVFSGLKKNVWQDRFRQVLDNGQPLGIENVVTPIGQKKRALTLSVIRTGEGLGIIASDRQRTEQELTERTAQLACLAEIEAAIAAYSLDRAAACTEIVRSLRAAMRYPECAGVKITMDGAEFQTDGFRATEWLMSAPVRLRGAGVGKLEIAYTEEKPVRDHGPFSTEERGMMSVAAALVAGLAAPVADPAAVSGEVIDQVIAAESARRVEFTLAMARELKTRLTPVLLTSDMLATELTEDPWADLVQTVHRGASGLAEKIDGMLDLARAEEGSLTIDKKSLAVGDLLKDVAREIIPVTSYYKQSLTMTVAENIPQIRADRKRLCQVLLSFVETATKITPEGGSIKLVATAEPERVLIEVRDTSPGMTPEQLRLIRDTETGDAGHESLYGLGLGLALARILVGLHGGEMWVNSEKGKGNTFGFSLPLPQNRTQNKERKTR